MKAIRSVLAGAGFVGLMVAAPAAAAAQLPDGTIVQVRLISPITSEDAKPGDTIRFSVTRDVIIDGNVVIPRKTRAVGTVVAARRARWGFIWRRPVLSFAFVETTAVDGQPVRLRAPNAYGQVNIDREGYHHDLQWATEGDTFEAAVVGDYAFAAKE